MPFVRKWGLWALAGLAACAAPGQARFEAEFPAHAAPAARPDVDDAADEATLAERPMLATALRVAVAHNPDLAAARARAEAAYAHVAGTGRLPDLQLKAELWGAPLARPWAWDDADAVLLGVRQELPAPGVRAATAHAAEEDARATGEAWRAAELDVVRAVHDAWAAYELAARALAIHREQIQVAGTLVELAGTLVASGRVAQDDVIQLDLEHARLHRDVVRLERDQRAAAVRLNALMGRAPAAPLGPPPVDDGAAASATSRGLPPLATVEQLALAHRPELAAAGHRALARRADADARRREARWPSFMIGADYWLVPEGEETHAYGLMLAVNLPWLNGRRADDVRAADAETHASEREATALRRQILAEVGVAHADVDAATRELDLLERELLPRARRGFESARTSFASGRGSTLVVLGALRTLLDVRIEEAHALVDLRLAWAALERAAGTSIDAEVRP